MSNFKLIVGPPGTGKTTYLLDILETELKTNDPDKIAFVSFTRTGSYEGRDRAISKFNYNSDDLPFFRTLHSTAFRKLNMKKSDMIAYDDKVKFGKLVGYNFKNSFTADLSQNDALYLFYIDAYRNNPKLGKQIIETHYLNVDDLLRIEKSYRAFKHEFSKVDYTDLIEEFIALDQPLPVNVAIVDEAQDLTTLQWKMIDVAFRNCERVYIAGDDDQAIYEWSGADISRFRNVGGEIKVLDHSYRLPNEILDFSKRITGNIRNRIEKDFEPSGGKGTVRTIGPDLEYELMEKNVVINPDESYLFLSRNKYYLSIFKNALIRMGVPFKFGGELFYDHNHIKAINIYHKRQKQGDLSLTERNFLRRYTTKGVTNFDAPWFDSLRLPKEKVEYYRMLIKNKAKLPDNPKVDIRTIHSVKGAEVDNVFMHLNITHAVNRNLYLNPDQEHRVFYVGATRAKKTLNLVLPNQKMSYDIDYDWVHRNELKKYTNKWGVGV